MQMIHHFTSNQKLEWFGYGEWVEEPDEVDFEHSGFTCKVIRVVKYEGVKLEHAFGGHFCGYVRIPQGHPWYGEKAYDIDCSVHGGLSWSGPPPFDNNDEWWVGFDCGHSGDIIPSMGKMLGEIREKDPMLKKLYNMHKDIRHLFAESYKTFHYAIGETQDLAQQASEATHVQTPT